MPSTWIASRSQHNPSQWSSPNTPLTYFADLRLPSISTTARRVHLFRDQDISATLLAVGQFCDDHCTAHHFKRKSVWIDNADGRRDHMTGLYMVNLPSFPIGSTLGANTGGPSSLWSGHTMGSPHTVTLLRASTKQFLTGIPGTTLLQASTGQHRNSHRPPASHSPRSAFYQTNDTRRARR